MLDDLNEVQRGAVTAGGGPVLVLAGAGSGKTRVITRRIAWLIEQGTEPWRILALTFTNKAAGEMLERVRRFHEAKGALVATFHSACARLLRIEAKALGYTNDFTIYDTYDRDQLLKELLKEQGYDGSDVRPGDVGARISRLKNRRQTPDDARPRIMAPADHAVAAVFEPYHLRMREQNAMDFDDLLLKFVELLEVSPDHREKYARRFHHVLVDEYQDTNRVQYQMLRNLAAGHGNLFVVGDPDQSIYRFRGADVENILAFERDFPGTRTIKLETNYRSTKNICDAADAVIRCNQKRKDKRLLTDNPPGDLLCLLPQGSEVSEAMEVTAQIRTLRAQHPAASTAVFFRAHFLSRSLEDAMRRDGIPYVIVGGLSFYERREIKDLLAYLRAAVNPRDDLSLMRILNVPSRGLGKASEERIVRHARDGAQALSAVLRAPPPGLPAKAAASLRELASTLDEIRAAGAQSAREALTLVLGRTGYLEYVARIGDAEDVDREQNIAELVSDAALWDEREEGGLPAWLARVSLLTAEDQEAPPDDAVQLMTIHSAKGLEFDHVFVIGLEEKLFPHERSETQDDMEEERRLFYVAVTRARKRCFLLHARRRMVFGREEGRKPSRFLAEIPPQLVEGYESEAGLDPGGSEPLHPEPEGGLREGDEVLHKAFGRGRLLQLSGHGINRKAVIYFPGKGQKTLLLEMARLERVEDS